MVDTAGNGAAEASGAETRALWAVALSWALVVMWAAVIFFMSAHTGSDLNEGTDLVARVKQWLNSVQLQLFGPGVDLASSIAHFCEYAVFGALLANAIRGHGSKRASRRRRWAFVVGVAVALASAYAITDEIHQIFVPDRACDVVDWIVDTAGAALGAGLWALLARRRQPVQGR